MLYSTIDSGTCMVSKFDILEEQIEELKEKFQELGKAFQQFTTPKEISYFDSLMKYIENNGLESEDTDGTIY